MEELKLFQSPIFGQVRTVVVNGQVMFAATDVARCLGYTNPQKAIRVHCKSAGVNEMDTPTNGGIQKVKFITKGNLVRLVANSELPQAEEVESWIFDEVIPTVLETGGYLATKQDDTPEEIMARALTIAQATLAKREERLKQLEAETEQQQFTIEIQTEEIKKAAPKVNYYDNHLQSVNALTATQIAKEIVAVGRFGPITQRGFSQHLKAWGKHCGIDLKKMHAHAFRHFFAKMFLKKNKDVIQLADLLGHGSVDTTRIYLQKSYDEQKKDFNRNVTW